MQIGHLRVLYTSSRSVEGDLPSRQDRPLNHRDTAGSPRAPANCLECMYVVESLVRQPA